MTMRSPIAAARRYLDRGWMPVPAPIRAKAPVLKAWQDLRLSEDELPRHFGDAPQNLGVLLGPPSGGLADVDLDCPLARRLADDVLPPTGARFGRDGARAAHRLYRVVGDLATARFRDPLVEPGSGERSMLVELRWTGCQTLVPPSVHPNGESIRWEEDGEPAEVAGATLRAAVGRLAAAVLLAQHWPAEGSRQDAALALSGGLLHGGWDAADAEWFVATVADAAADDEARARQTAARSTARADDAGRPTTGWPRLASLVGDKVVDAAREWLGIRSRPAGSTGPSEDGSGPNKARSASGETSQATMLVGLAKADGVECFRDAQGEPYVSFQVGGHLETWPLRSKTVRQWLARLFYLARGKAPGSQALQDALRVLDGEARFAGPERPVAVRLAEHDGSIFLDLGDAGWRVVAITPDGWSIAAAADCPVRFRRPHGMQALPEPRSGGSVWALRPLLNLADENEFLLIVGWLVGCLYPLGPRAILQLLGEQGSAKSSQARLLRSMVDPNAVPLRAQPRDEGDLLIAAINGALVALDNVSVIPGWLSDALCRLATGGGLSKRELYTDADEVLLDARRPVVLTAIAEAATASDLLDRTLTVTLPPIPPEDRRTEADLEAAIAAAKPLVLSGLLDAVAAGLANLPTTRLPRKPRLADFATFVEAAAPALGWEPGAFVDAMDATRREADSVAIEALPIGPALLAFMEPRHGWEGSATELLKELNHLAADETRKDRAWPKQANRLSAQLRRLGPNLRAIGVSVGNDRRTGGQRLVSLSKNAEIWDRHSRRERLAEPRGHGTDRDDGDRRASSPEPSASSADRHERACDEARGDDGDGRDDAGAMPLQRRFEHASDLQDNAPGYEEFEL